MEICGHCHNVLSKTVDQCTVCGTRRVDPDAADVRRRNDGDLPSHAPGWAAPPVSDPGIHPEDFLRELGGDAPAAPGAIGPTSTPNPPPALPPRQTPATPAPGALAGYLGTSIDRRPAEPTTGPAPIAPPVDGSDPAMVDAGAATQPAESSPFAEHLSTATRVAPDGVAARTTRLDGTVQLGPTSTHRLLTIGAPLVAAALVITGVVGSYRVQASEAEQTIEAEAAELTLNEAAAAQAQASILRLDLDGCGIIAQTTGFLFADQTILVAQSEIVTDNRPKVLTTDGTTFPAETLGWSLERNLAVVRAEDRIPGGLEWGVSARVRAGDAVNVLAISGPGSADAVPATIETANTINGRNTSFELDVEAAEGSVVLNADGFVIGVLDDRNFALASDDVAPAVSRIVLANDLPQAVCPLPPTTLPPAEGDDDAEPTTSEDTGADE